MSVGRLRQVDAMRAFGRAGAEAPA